MKKSLLLSAAGLLALSTTAMYADDVDVLAEDREIVDSVEAPSSSAGPTADREEQVQFALRLTDEELSELQVAESALVKVGVQEQELVTQLAAQLPAEDQPESLKTLAGWFENGRDLVPVAEVGQVFMQLRSIVGQQVEIAEAASKNAESVQVLITGVLENCMSLRFTKVEADEDADQQDVDRGEEEEVLTRSIDMDDDDRAKDEEEVVAEPEGQLLLLTPGFVREAQAAQLEADAKSEELGSAFEEATADTEEVRVEEAIEEVEA